ncbi:MAG: alpha-ketoacid dehydrogenase subunit beta [Candidatus Micrarchaeota archaeon]|nr:alpha-ketoacid dehydrogenase subunit beta [Candidatus Micrarchaeota archaeon]
MAEVNMIQAINMALAQEMERDKRIVIFGEDVGKNGGVFRVTDGLQDKFGQERVFDTPLAESGIIGTAVGMAYAGLRPIPEIQFDGFSFLAYNQINAHAARIRNRTRGRYSMPIIIRMPYGGGVRALELHAEPIEGMFANIPGITILVPSGPYEAKGLLAAAAEWDDPVLFLEHKRLYRAFKENVPENRYTLPIGKCRIAREGADVTIVAWGAMVRVAENAANELRNDGISCEIIDVRAIKPLDDKAIADSVRKTGRLVIVQEAMRGFSASSEIAARIAEKALTSLRAPILRVTGYDVPVPLPKLEEYFIPNERKVKSAVLDVMRY